MRPNQSQEDAILVNRLREKLGSQYNHHWDSFYTLLIEKADILNIEVWDEDAILLFCKNYLNNSQINEQISWISKSKGMYCLLDYPSEQVTQIYKMLWEI